jgi:response regulator RpfG family c-di-GMP phosphodiesterase
MISVLVLHGSSESRATLAAWLQELGAVVTVGGHAAEALAVLASGEVPDVVFCDTHLPGADGLLVAEQLREQAPAAAVVITTDSYDLQMAIHALHAGAVDYLPAPITRDHVAEAFRRALDAHERRVAHARMRQELTLRRRQVTEMLAELEQSTATSLGAVLAARRRDDAGALGTAHRLARLAVGVALALNVREPQLSDIERAVFLHDPGPPTPAERQSLEILRGIPGLSGAVDIALAAHERFDGSGAPRGLLGEQIPLGARILAVVAAYQEMVASGAPAAAAVERLRTERGGEFDPAVLDALATLQPWHTPPDTRAETERRRWARKRTAPDVVAQASEGQAQIVDASYGGFCMRVAASVVPEAGTSFMLQFAGLDVIGDAVWMTRLANGAVLCGAAVGEDLSQADSRWRTLVDSWPPGAANEPTA